MKAGGDNDPGFVSEADAGGILDEVLESTPVDGERVLVITPDSTRSGPLPLLFRLLVERLLPRVEKLDFLIALGTHQPMSDDAVNRLYGITARDREGRLSGVGFHNHQWERPETFREVGTISAAETERISGGLLHREVRVSLNRMIFDYDRLLICGPVFPHEVAGFSGGHKYLFPGIAGSEIIDFTHWLGALITNHRIIGVADTPVREVIEKAAGMVEIPTLGVCYVVEGESGLAGLYAGPVEEAWRKAVALSSRTHIRWVDRPFSLAVSIMPEMYDDLWTGAKGMYKVEPAMADGGEVIIYAPHIREVSHTHGSLIEEVGYHVRDYFVKQWDRFRDYPGGVLAHSTHLKGAGTFEGGVERPRVKVTLCTGIPRPRCEKLSVGYLDPSGFDPDRYEGRESEGVLVAHRAGEVLYRLKDSDGGESGKE